MGCEYIMHNYLIIVIHGRASYDIRLFWVLLAWTCIVIHGRASLLTVLGLACLESEALFSPVNPSLN